MASIPSLIGHALSLVALGTVYLTGVVLVADRARMALSRPRVRRGMDAFMGVAMVGFGAKMAAGS